MMAVRKRMLPKKYENFYSSYLVKSQFQPLFLACNAVLCRSFILSVPSSCEIAWQVQLNLVLVAQSRNCPDCIINGFTFSHFREPILIRREQQDDVMGANLHQLCCADQFACCIFLSVFWRTRWLVSRWIASRCLAIVVVSLKGLVHSIKGIFVNCEC